MYYILLLTFYVPACMSMCVPWFLSTSLELDDQKGLTTEAFFETHTCIKVMADAVSSCNLPERKVALEVHYQDV